MTTMRKLLATALLAIATVASAQTTNLKVMSFNIRFDTPKDTGIISWKSRCQPCADVIHHVQPDVIGMQEPRGPQYEQVIATLPDYTYLRIPLGGEVTEKKSGRIMVFFKTDKYEMKKWGYFWLTEKYEHPGYSFETTDRGNIRAAIWVKLKDKQTGRQFFFLTGCRIVRRKRIYGKCLVVNMLCGILRSAVVSNGPENAAVFFIEAVLCHKIISTLRIP